jgi:predicted nucleotide-binding protein
MIVEELKDFRYKLMQFAVYRRAQITSHKELTKKERADAASIYEEISISAGKYAPLIKEYTGLATISMSAGPEDVWNWAFRYSKVPLVISALDMCLQATGRTIGNLEDDIKKGIRDEQGNIIGKPHLIQTEPPKAFIVHGGRSGVLDKLRDFVEALGIKPLIVEMLPSKGMLLADKVKKYQQEADCAIILATRGGIIDMKSGKQHPRLNVIDELSSFYEAFPEKVIVLLEKGAELPSNKAGLTNEPFARQSMDRAFTAIARELVEMKILKAVKP